MSEFGVEEFDSPDLNPIKHLCDELERTLLTKAVSQMRFWKNGQKFP